MLRTSQCREGETVVVRAEGHSAGPWVDEPEVPTRSDRDVVDALLAGDEATYLALVHRYHRSMIRVARRYLPSEALAEEVAQDAWMVVLEHLKQWEGRASLKTWIFCILANQARAGARRETRTVPFSALAGSSHEGDRSIDPGCPGWPDPLESREVLDTIRSAIDALPPMQRAVITLRDVVGCDADEACATLQLSAANQRVLLHRARAKVRATIESYFRAGAEGCTMARD